MDIHQQAFADYQDALLSLLKGAAAAFERADAQLLERADNLAVQAANLLAYRRANGLQPQAHQQSMVPGNVGGVPVPQGMAPVAVHYAPAGPPAQSSHFGGGPLMGPQTVPPPMQPMHAPPAPPPPPNPAAATPPPIMPIRPSGQ